MKFINILEKCSLFEHINSNEIEKMLKCLDYKIKYFNENDIIVLSSDKIDFIGILLDGELQITKEDPFGNNFILSKVNKTEIFGEAIACSNIDKSPVNVICSKKATVLFIPYKNVITPCSSICKFHTKIIENLLKTISNKNIFLNYKIELLTCKTIRDKLNLYFSIQIGLNNSHKFIIPFSRQELADFLDINRSALSRELSNMQKEKLIEFKNNEFKINYKLFTN